MSIFTELNQVLLDIKNEEERIGRFRRREDFTDTIELEDKIELELKEV